MSLIENMYYDWSDDQTDSQELKIAYSKLADEITKLVGIKKHNELDTLIMECVCQERLAAFRGGFQQATSIWKECC